MNPAFRAALAIEPVPFCRGCHAPEADPSADPAEAGLRDLGVGCVSCHVPSGEGQAGAAVLAPARTDRDADAKTSAPHPVRRSVAFANDGACSGCHEFAFPPGPGRWAVPLAEEDDADLMQTTVREHRRSAGSEKTCASCHMPGPRGASGHGFRQTRDPAFLRDHVVISATRDGDEVAVTLRQTTPGHRLPTGDLFRRLEVGAELRDTNGRAIVRATRHLARHFAIDPRRGHRTLTQDDRLGDGPTTLTLSLVGAAAHLEKDKYTVFFWVDYQRVATVGEGVNPATASVESSVRLREGVLP